MRVLAFLLLAGCNANWTAVDFDGDGLPFGEDCNDLDASVGNAEEIWYDGIDQDCDGNDADADGDGFIPAFYAADYPDTWQDFPAHLDVGDCWDRVDETEDGFEVVPDQGWVQPTAAEVFPGADDLWYDGVDQDCGGEDDFDADGDGYRSASYAQDALGTVGDDCVDEDADEPNVLTFGCEGVGDFPAEVSLAAAGLVPADIHPGADDPWHDGVDQDCGGEDDFDPDGDGFVSCEECAPEDPDIFPTGAADTDWFNCDDENCDGNAGDQDGDGYVSAAYMAACDDWDDTTIYTQHRTEVTDSPELDPFDCWDDPVNTPTEFTPLHSMPVVLAADVYPRAAGADTWYDGIDADCREDDDFDQDLDTHSDLVLANRDGVVGDDCDDTDPDVYPGVDGSGVEATEICDDIDSDCDNDLNDLNSVGCDSYYFDGDVDGFGAGSTTRCQCEGDLTTQFSSLLDTDCDDGDDQIYPGATEITGDEVDSDCDDGEICFQDTDDDGYRTTLTVVSSDVDCTDSGEARASEDDDDCDDNDPDQYPGATEYCSGEDDDCDGDTDEDGADDVLTWYRDSDSDTYGDVNTTDIDCYEPSGYVADNTDCDDTDGTISPAGTEICGGTDEDCDTLTDEDGASDVLTWYRDSDTDTYGDSATTDIDCEQPTGYVADSTDCDDTDGTINPAGTEVCGGTDEDCDTVTDEDGASDVLTWYRDSDSDTYGDLSTTDIDCYEPTGYVADSTDCDDTDGTINPAGTEICGGTDEDCDTLTDEDGASDVITWYRDSDTDTYGDPSVTDIDCTQPSGYVADATDCDDTDSSINTAGTEVCGGTDEDCDTVTDEDGASDVLTWYRDSDSDTYGDSSTTDIDCTQPTGYVADSTDCDDTDGTINPAGTEICGGTDEDCDTVTDEDGASDVLTWYRDSDTDTYGDLSTTDIDCAQPTGYVSNSTDCDDTDGSINPAGTEVCGGTDEDCDTVTDEDGASDVITWYRDSDTDTYGDPNVTDIDCTQPSGYVADATDCDDTDGTINTAGTEVCGGADEDCDTVTDEDGASDVLTWYRDSDSDTYGDSSTTDIDCTQPTGYVADSTDCDDTDGTISPAGTEVCGGADEDCDTVTDEDGASDVITWYDDSDTDTYGDPATTDIDCTQPTGYVADNTDCDPTDGSIYPGATEVRQDGTDQDCDGVDAPYILSDLAAGDLFFSELGIKPGTVTDANGEWFEVYNDSGGQVDLDGLYVYESNSTGSFNGDFTVSGELLIESGGYVVFGSNDDTATNGDVPVDYEWDNTSDIKLNNQGETLAMAESSSLTVVFDDVTWDGGNASTDYWPDTTVGGDTLNLDSGHFDADQNDHPGHWCVPTGTFGDGDYGTPGAANESCGYTYTWTADVGPLFASNCSSCHTSGSSGSMTDIDGTWSNTVFATSTQASPYYRVDPFNSGDSYLWAKLNGDQLSLGGSGNDMPNGGPSLSAGDLLIIETWIDEGAPE